MAPNPSAVNAMPRLKSFSLLLLAAAASEEETCKAAEVYSNIEIYVWRQCQQTMWLNQRALDLSRFAPLICSIGFHIGKNGTATRLITSHNQMIFAQDRCRCCRPAWIWAALLLCQRRIKSTTRPGAKVDHGGSMGSVMKMVKFSCQNYLMKSIILNKPCS